MGKDKIIIVKHPRKCPFRQYDNRKLNFKCGLTSLDCWEDCPLQESNVIVKAGDKEAVKDGKEIQS
jgi:hypothetical protein